MAKAKNNGLTSIFKSSLDPDKPYHFILKKIGDLEPERYSFVTKIEAEQALADVKRAMAGDEDWDKWRWSQGRINKRPKVKVK